MDTSSPEIVADHGNSDNEEGQEGEEGEVINHNDVSQDDEDLTFQIIVGGSLRGKCLLKDNRGYTYTSKVEKGNKQWWRCSVRTNTFRCGASVTQVGDNFTPGRYPHEHPPPVRKIGAKARRTPKPKASLTPDSSMYVCRPLQDEEDYNDDHSYGDMESEKSSPIKMKIRRKESFNDDNSNANIPDDLIWIEKERLMIEKQRLNIEKERLDIEKQRLEESRNHNSRCSCMNPSSNSMLL